MLQQATDQRTKVRKRYEPQHCPPLLLVSLLRPGIFTSSGFVDRLAVVTTHTDLHPPHNGSTLKARVGEGTEYMSLVNGTFGSPEAASRAVSRSMFGRKIGRLVPTDTYFDVIGPAGIAPSGCWTSNSGHGRTQSINPFLKLEFPSSILQWPTFARYVAEMHGIREQATQTMPRNGFGARNTHS